MELKALGFKSEQIFTSFDGIVIDRGSYLVIKTLTTPNFFWGNLIIFERPPRIGDYENWVEIFKKEFPDPRIYHVTLAWDNDSDNAGDSSEFVSNGFALEANVALVASEVTIPPKFHNGLEVRALVRDEEWSAMIELQIKCAHDNLSKEAWEQFYISQSERYQKMTAAGMGNWFGGFIDGKLVCGLGIFHKDEIGRYQIVCTDPDYQRQGFCGTLVYKTAKIAFEKMNVKKLVMCADPDYFAIKIYESVGFKRQQLEYGVCYWDKECGN